MAYCNQGIDDVEASYDTDAFTCSVCYSRLKKIKMCPRCSKMFHAECLAQWLQQKQTCPNCVSPLMPNEAVVCRWAEEVLQHFKDLENKNKSLSAERKQILEVLKSGKEKYGFKVIVIGSIAVGKTALLRRFAEDKFDFSFPATTGFEYVQRKILICGDIIRLILVDTAGQEQYDALTTSLYRDADAIIIAYDVINKESFENVKSWHNKALLHSAKTPIMLLVATKADLNDKRVVSTEEGQKLAEKLGIRFLETSALHKVNVEETFYSIAATLKARQDQEMEEDFKKRGNKKAKKGESSIKLKSLLEDDDDTKQREKCPCLIL